MRNVAMFSCIGYVKQDDFNRAWPLAGEGKKRGKITIDDAMRETIKRIHNIDI
mgnify:CR=1 FL=1